MKNQADKKLMKVNRIDCYIVRYRENLRLQDELEKKRKGQVFGTIFRKDINESVKK